ncbi:EamA family transporter [Actinocatenispora rupis]|uniref:EamA family transporter n=1 Tax=Actinocatenispora rupis TaxID=519421 RepID=UPI00194513B0|nr:EamA family transporter [Actinocatenispora rupis]
MSLQVVARSAEAAGGGGPARLARTAIGAVPPPGLILLGIVSIQVGAALAKNLFGVFPPTAVVSVRLVTAALVLGCVVRPRLRGHSRTDWAVVGLLGLTFAVMNSAIYQSMARIPLGVAVTVEFLGPLSVAIAGSRRVRDALWVVLAGGGVLLLARGGGGVDAIGVLWALLAAAAWAGYILLGASTGRRFPGTSGLAMAMAIGALLAAPVGVAQAGTDLLSPRLLVFGAAAGLLSSAIPYALEIEALRRMPARVFAILMSVEPAVAALVGMVVLGELLGVRQWVAIACVIVASIGATRSTRRPRETPET